METLRVVFGRPYDRVRGLLDGSIQPDGIELHAEVAETPVIAFQRLLRGEFDIGEMSMSFYSILRSFGDDRLTAIPIFPLIMFRHADILVREDDPYHEPEDLIGKVVALPEYSMTIGVWLRGLLSDEWGIKPESIEWVSIRQPVAMEGPSASIPAGISHRTVEGVRPLQMLRASQVDAAFGSLPAHQGGDVVRVRSLLDGAVEREREYFQRTGIFPVQHLVAIRKELCESDTTLATRIYEAFRRAKQSADDALDDFGFPCASIPQLQHLLVEQRSYFGKDLWPYGVAKNRKSIETFLRYCSEQGLMKRPLEVADLFVPELLDT